MLHNKEIVQLQDLHITPYMAPILDQIQLGHSRTIFTVSIMDQVYQHITVHQMSHIFSHRGIKEEKVTHMDYK